MERFVFWTGGSIVAASCRLCDLRLEFESPTDGAVVLQATEDHNCLMDEQESLL